MSRIRCIDRILRPYARLYVNFGFHHTVESDGRLVQREPNGFEICLNPAERTHREAFNRIVDKVRCVYVHTVHLADFVVEWLASGKFIVDSHGIVPEEETMLGRPELAPKYALVEEKVLKLARAVVVVSRPMAAHYGAKYPHVSAEMIHLPIYEQYPEQIVDSRRDDVELPVNVAYAGATQVWQNLDAMLQLAKDCMSFAKFSFYSHDREGVLERAQKICPASRVKVEFCEKSNLPPMYRQQHFGLALRDDSPVNRVSCPTKVAEYLKFGVIPIVRSPLLGDYQEYGYRYVYESEFRDGFFPDARSRAWMREANFWVDHSVKQAFESGRVTLENLIEAGN